MSTITNPPASRKPRGFEPITGRFAWLTPWKDGTGRLVISTRTGAAIYTVTAIRTEGGPNFGGQLVGYQLANEGNGEVYHVALEAWGWDCSCWDGLLRQQYADTPECRGCKHVVGLQTSFAGKEAA
jgi:hypothetical protein